MSVLGQAAARRVAAVLALAPALTLAVAAAGIAPAAAMNPPEAAMHRSVRIEITSVTAQRSDDQPLLVVHVSNKGRRAVDLSGELRLTDGPSGDTAGPFRVPPVVSLEPGQDMDVDFALPVTLPSGPWLANVTLTSGRYTASASSTVTFANPKASWSWVTMAWMVTGVSIVIALIIVGVSLVVRGLPA